MSLPSRRALCVIVLVAMSAAGTARSDEPATQSPPPPPQQPDLKMAPEIVPPAPHPATPGLGGPAPQGPALALPGMPTKGVQPIARGATPQQTRTLPAGKEEESEYAVFLRADQIQTFGQDRVEASGSVELRTRDRTVLADRLLYDVDLQRVRAFGNVTLRQGPDWMSGPELYYLRDSSTGYFLSPQFYINVSGGRGDASRIDFTGPDTFDVTDGRYTTCNAPRNDWFLQAQELEIDRSRNVGTAHDATIRFFERPIFYSPYLEFPLNNERKSGFLTPTAGSTGTRGLELTTPYYLNLAPNYDATITPRIMTRRGLQLGGQFRYLFSDPQPMLGEVDAEVLPDDRVTDSTRYALSWRHSEQIAPWLTGYLNLNKVSDDTYFADLSDRIAVTSQSTLPRDGALIGHIGPVSFTARMQSFQTLQDPTQPITPPYNTLPQLTASTGTEIGGVQLFATGEYTAFRNAVQPEGDRSVLFGSASYSRAGSWWFFTARGGMHMRWYDLDTPGALGAHPAVYVPISSLDGGLIFERDWKVFDADFTQTLEPRLFYTYIPFRNQNALPVFDTAIDDFNFSQLFTENRYLGNDRIGDANQLTVAATSRLLDSITGAERLRVAVGERFYFSDQRVTLSETPRSSASSDILVQVSGKLSDVWALQGLVQQNLDVGQNEQLNAAIRYTPALGKALNFGYRYTRELIDPTTGDVETLKQFDISGEWPVDDHLTLLGRWNYSLQDRKTLEAIAGVEYNQDCWILRLVFHRLTTTTEQTTNAVFVQLELNGLARIGTSPLDLLKRSVPGYLRTNDPALMGRDPRLEPLPDF
jgi:LPS-assembly protein